MAPAWRSSVGVMTVVVCLIGAAPRGLHARRPNGPGCQAGEYQVKAAFLANFARFVNWPDSAFPAPDTPLWLGVIGVDPFGPALDEVLAGRRFNGRLIKVRPIRPGDPVAGLHILFVSASEAPVTGRILARTRGLPVLTVGESAGFCERGGGVNLVLDRRRVRLEINPVAVSEAGLRVHAQLMALARLVGRAAGSGR